MKRPPWVMDELYRSLSSNWDREAASKGLQFAIRYVRRERARQVRILTSDNDETSEERQDLSFQALAWREGPYGKLWAANMRDRPRPNQLLSANAVTHDNDQVFNRCSS